MADPLILALGGTRSGKSRFGLAAATRLAGEGRAWFLATAWPGDPELDDRIARHRARAAGRLADDRGRRRSRRRPSRATEPDEPVLIDGLTLWLSALLGDEPPAIDPILDGPVAAGLAAIAAPAGPGHRRQRRGRARASCRCIAGARAYRDLVGIAHQRLAALADEVVLSSPGCR